MRLRSWFAAIVLATGALLVNAAPAQAASCTTRTSAVAGFTIRLEPCLTSTRVSLFGNRLRSEAYVTFNAPIPAFAHSCRVVIWIVGAQAPPGFTAHDCRELANHRRGQRGYFNGTSFVSNDGNSSEYRARVRVDLGGVSSPVADSPVVRG